MPSIRWLPRSTAQLRPVVVAEVVDVAGTRGVERRRLDPLGEDRPEGDQVGVDARVRLHVGVRGAEERLGVVGGAALDGVDVLAPGVEAVADRALGVLVGEPVAHGQQHGRRGVVLAGDELQRARAGRPARRGWRSAIRRLDGADDVEGAAIGDRCCVGVSRSGGGGGRMSRFDLSMSAIWSMRRWCRPPSNGVDSHSRRISSARSAATMRPPMATGRWRRCAHG